jgi:hypothetical protein
VKRAVALLALLLAGGALAEEPRPGPPSPMRAPEASLSPLRLDARDLLPVERRARYRRNVGIGLAVPGVSLVVIGAVLIGAGARDSRLVAGAAEIAGGAVATGLGVVFTVPGALLWIGGQDDLDLVAWRRRRLSE